MTEITNEEREQVARLEAVLEELGGNPPIIEKDISLWRCGEFVGATPLRAATFLALDRCPPNLPDILRKLADAADAPAEQPQPAIPDEEGWARDALNRFAPKATLGFNGVTWIAILDGKARYATEPHEAAIALLGDIFAESALGAAVVPTDDEALARMALVRFLPGATLEKGKEMWSSMDGVTGYCDYTAWQTAAVALLQHAPERYAYHEQQEQEFREFIGSDVSMLTDRRGDGKKKTLTLTQLRESVQGGCKVASDDWGACSCFMEPEEA